MAVVGGGLTGVEMAAEIAEGGGGHRVSLITAGSLGQGFLRKGRDHLRTVLTSRGVRVEEGRRVAGADDIEADAVLWAASMAAGTELAGLGGLSLAPSGRIAVDPALRSVSHPEVYAAGDAADARSVVAGPLRMACATALPAGSAVASAIVAEMRGEEPHPLSFGFVILCVSLGRHDGLVQFVRPDDSPRDAVLTGRPAAWVKEQIVRSTVRFLRLAARAPWAVPLIPGIGH
ncbi:Pyridine nucleotide-disulphide oxidoreductase [Sinosporangium album]|uniref:Pyridine nucleotide-disulphide oxidoreductase n=1 Tax=Sinosporangium album TaxID=504805 RepID=A0A1G7YRM3_9ACTN|nr:Pyridine nucleotide-disulphide oxidoreductase [Sinosporangium album]